MNKKQILGLLLIPFFLAACMGNEAPVIEGWKQGSADRSDYRVQPNDTVYSVAWSFGIDYRDITRLNHLKEPYTLKEGQLLHLAANTKSVSSATPKKSAQTAAEAIPVEAPSSIVSDTPAAPTTIPTPQPTSSSRVTETKPIAVTATMPTEPVKAWLWPTKGTILQGFSNASGGNKGLDIGGQLGQPITATATGKVVYTGASLPGYGNLVIIKHNDNDLSAYAFNKVIAVKEGEMIKAGQLIAQMGKNETGKVLLHFEIRQKGKPVDPMLFLKNSKK